MLDLLNNTGLLTIHFGDVSSENIIHLNSYLTLFLAGIIYLLGRKMVNSISLLQNYTIPAPVAGGVLVAIILLILHQQFNLVIQIEEPLQRFCMLIFFASVGLSANISKLLKGGITLIVFFFVVTLFLILQNVVGISLAYLFDINPLIGLLSGSITLSGGHGTGIAWANNFVNDYGLTNAMEVAMACATFGLVLGGLIGGPVARFIIQHTNALQNINNDDQYEGFEKPERERPITAGVVIRSILLLVSCLVLGILLEQMLKMSGSGRYSLPTFVCVLFVGVIFANVMPFFCNYKNYNNPTSVLGNTSLSLFVVMALVSLKLWQLVSLAVPILVILAVQVVLMILYSITVTYYVCYRITNNKYDSAVISAGHCGFGLGAMPTAIANMQSVTDRFGSSHIAFLIVPMVGAFFIDIANTFIIKFFLIFI